MCAQDKNASPGTLMTQALLVPLETTNEKITDSLSQAIWCRDPKLLAAARPSISPALGEPSTVLLAKVLGIGLSLSPNSETGTKWVMGVCPVGVQFRKKDGKVCRAHPETHTQRVFSLIAPCGLHHFLKGLCPLVL